MKVNFKYFVITVILTRQIRPTPRRGNFSRATRIMATAPLQKEKLKYTDQRSAQNKIVLPTAVCHNCVMEDNFKKWLEVSCLATVE